MCAHQSFCHWNDMGCNQSKQTPDAPPPKSTGNKLNASRRDSVAVTKARMEKNKDKVKEKAPPGINVEVIEWFQYHSKVFFEDSVVEALMIFSLLRVLKMWPSGRIRNINILKLLYEVVLADERRKHDTNNLYQNIVHEHVRGWKQ